MRKQEQTWLGITVPCEEAAIEPVANFLFELGAGGVEEHKNAVTAYFDVKAGTSALINSLNVFIDSLMKLKLVVGKPEYFEQKNEDWSFKWRENFHAIPVTENIVVKPPWETWKGKHPIVIDIMPRMAFGTGSHESTQLCLVFIETAVRTRGITVLDVGTGSGILAIAAAKMGAAVVAMDIDETALENARENIQLNHTAVEIKQGSPEAVPLRQFDLIIANINRKELIRLFPELIRFSHAATRMIFSGLLIHDLEDFVRLIESKAWSVIGKRTFGEWAALMVGRSIVNKTI